MVIHEECDMKSKLGGMLLSLTIIISLLSNVSAANTATPAFGGAYGKWYWQCNGVY